MTNVVAPDTGTAVDAGALREAMTGALVTQDSADYDDVRRVWNGDVDRRPAMLARCESDADVVAAIGFARRAGLEIAVRGGAHSVGGASTVDGGLVIDLSRMNDVQVDLERRLAKVGGGALLRDVDAATQEYGLAFPVGAISHTGIGGLALGGGMGWLTRRHGLSIDNLESARVVTADGQVLRAAADENPELFWALRGGGGNFGVVTEFEFRLHEVGPMIQFGMLFWELEQGAEVLRLARDVLATLPVEFNIIFGGMNAPPAPFVPEQHHLRPGYGMIVVGFGGPEAHAELVARLSGALPPLVEFAGPMPYVALQQMMDEASAWGRHSYEKGAYLTELTDEAIKVVTTQVPRRNSPLSMLLFYRLDGAYSEVAEDTTAFGGRRSPRFAVYVLAVCLDAATLAADRAWARATWQALRPHAATAGCYVNSMAEHEDDRVRAAYGGKYQRLARVKSSYDPENVFHRNMNVTPG
ncbi:MAG TPA: FAD-binding oxidoreductase [Pseudonocardia sp.]|jgi:FAD/FMN-containing dehydrogenase|uniref:FAD-binding oxidoreductase n=1 Tax=Pseudonocardia sp. TaxID=60912 RepID=UPI002F3F2ABF